MYEMVMPRLEQSMESGIITCWHKHEGDLINQGDVLFEVETEKVTLDVESTYTGYVRKIVRQAGEDVKVLELVAYLGALDENVPNDIASQNKQPEPHVASETAQREPAPEEKKPPQNLASAIPSVSGNYALCSGAASGPTFNPCAFLPDYHKSHDRLCYYIRPPHSGSPGSPCLHAFGRSAGTC